MYFFSDAVSQIGCMHDRHGIVWFPCGRLDSSIMTVFKVKGHRFHRLRDKKCAQV